ncbi:MAG: universal stress protein [Methanomassiliicoccales archaeon]
MGVTNILLATDGKEHSAKAVRYAFDHAKDHKATLFVVFVVSPKADEDKERVIKQGLDELDRLKEMASKEGIEIKTMLEAGSPYDTILKASDRVNANEIVVGTSGKTVIDRVLIGSVSEYVVRNARCTVIVVR